MEDAEKKTGSIFSFEFIRSGIKRIKRNRKLREDTLLVTISGFFAMAMGLITVPLITRFLSKSEYGTLGFIASIQYMIIAFSAPGMVNAIAMGVTRNYEGTFPHGTFRRLRIFIRNSALLIPVAAWYWFFEHDSYMGIFLLISGFTLPWMYGFDTSEQYLVGRAKFRMIFFRRILVTLLVAAGGIAAAYFFRRAIEVYIARAILFSITFFLIFKFLEKRIQNQDIDPEFNEKSRQFSVVSILGTVGKYIDTLVIGKFIGLDILAGFTLSLTIATPLQVLSKSFIKVFYSRLTTARSSHQLRLIALLSCVSAAIIAAFLLTVWWLALPLVDLLFPKYPEIHSYVPFLLFNAAISMPGILGHTYALFNRYKWWYRYYQIRNSLLIPASVIAVFVGGVWGAIYLRTFFAIVEFMYFNILLLKKPGKEN